MKPAVNKHSTKNVCEWLEEKCTLNGSRPFIYWQDEVITYGQFRDAYIRAARAFHALGLRRGDRVALVLSNSPEYLVLWFGLARIGAVAVLINTGFKGEGLRYLLERSQVKALVADTGLADTLRDVLPPLANLETLIWLPQKPEGNPPAHAEIRSLSYDQLLNFSGSLQLPDPDWPRGTPMALVHTSGTTGPAKICVLSHGYYLSLARFIADSFGMTSADRVYNPLPLFHINPHYAVFGAMDANSALVLVRRFSASRLWEEVKRYEATVLILHIWPLHVLKKRREEADWKGHRIRIAFPADAEFMRLFEIPSMMTGYGSTEAGGLITAKLFRNPVRTEDYECRPLWTVTGQCRRDVELAIVDENDFPMPPGTIGEIVVRARAPHVLFDGYFGMPEQTVKSFRNQWFHTGDLGWVNEIGELHFVRRAAENIRVRGEFVDIDLVEQTIRSYPGVLDCAIVGIPAELSDEEIKAFVQPFEAASIDAPDLHRYLREKLPKFMVPRFISIVPELPRVPGTGKVRKELLDRTREGSWDAGSDRERRS